MRDNDKSDIKRNTQTRSDINKSYSELRAFPTSGSMAALAEGRRALAAAAGRDLDPDLISSGACSSAKKPNPAPITVPAATVRSSMDRKNINTNVAAIFIVVCLLSDRSSMRIAFEFVYNNPETKSKSTEIHKIHSQIKSAQKQ